MMLLTNVLGMSWKIFFWLMVWVKVIEYYDDLITNFLCIHELYNAGIRRGIYLTISWSYDFFVNMHLSTYTLVGWTITLFNYI